MNKLLEKYLRDFPRNAPDPSGGTPPAATPPASTPPAGTPPAGTPPAAQPPASPPSLELPPNLPAHFRGDTYQKTIENLLGAYEPLRVKLDSVKPPDRPDAYQLTLEGALAGYGETLKNDPIMPEARKLAHNVGMSQDQYQRFVSGFINIMHDKGAFAPMPTDAKIAEGLIDASLQGNSRAEAVTGGTKRLTDARAFVDGLKDDKSGFTAHERAELAMMVNSPGGVQLVERFMKLGQQQTVSPGGAGAGDANLMAEYEKRLQDPRNREDPAFAAETREMSKRVFARR